MKEEDRGREGGRDGGGGGERREKSTEVTEERESSRILDVFHSVSGGHSQESHLSYFAEEEDPLGFFLP